MSVFKSYKYFKLLLLALVFFLTSTEDTSSFVNLLMMKKQASAISCSGVVVGGYCWYYGTAGQSCTTVCSSHGGYNLATKTYAGSDGTTSNCKDVLDALSATGSGVTAVGGYSNGCVTFFSNRYRNTDATVEGGSQGSTRRACACNN